MAGNQPVVIKKVKKVSGGGHHGGAWKVAYADFVTAMMAFFLLMWLINTTSPEQKRGIADYFAPAAVSSSTSGTGGVLGGTSISTEGSRSQGSRSIIEQLSPETPRTVSREVQEIRDPNQPIERVNLEVSESALDAALAIRERAQFERAEQSLRQAIENLPEIAELSRHLLVDQTPEGMRIQLVDQEGRSMFEPASAQPNARAVRLLEAVASIVDRLPNRISISGHTDSRPSGDNEYSNWELSSDRANAARRILSQNGVRPDRIALVSGRAGTEPLYPDDPDLPGNRRISIVLLREAPVLPPDFGL
ncbi:flagellar motor protein MotB [Ponticaulis sp.]|uniref:flagellar motor protein MotB n=1 Tax=Ponticaulis sp. TaxID=2020902 RepID=UPI000B6405B0|nr:flagellar motor protein MotB [Ponticaulis sp.]MAI89655.1 chemotaxis protein MotB [Ponticaulis sp.]OUY00675.1 MAG: chemotaxis protein MotB [Hyphomonadaceae bacterium TMED5]|tara:strand:- start:136642 stop:137559 length:918 start_codon:yes stop_codon:yes gene_type:complete